MATRIGRLTKPIHRATQREGLRYADDVVVIYLRRNGLAARRVGISVGRQFGGAVSRNRLRRKIRSAISLQWALIPAGMDAVVIPKARAAALAVTDLEGAFARLLRGWPPKRSDDGDVRWNCKHSVCGSCKA